MIVSTVFTISASALQDSLIDKSKTACLNIYKYEMDDTTEATFKGTGREDDKNNIPSSATPLAGVEFKITRVVDLVDSSGNLNTTYYTSAGVSLPTAAEAKKMTAIATYTKTTDSDGYAKFTDLPLGIYYVEETSNRPDRIVEPTAPFVVSLPRTNTSGLGWNYDVYVYPKNQLTYKPLVIKKVDYNNNSTVLSGASFSLYRSYEKPSSDSDWKQISTGQTTGTDGTVTISKVMVGCYYKLVETAAPDGYILDENNKTTYFYFNSSGKVCNYDTKTATSSNVVTVTNTKPTISKKETNSKANLWTYNLSDMSYSVGDTIYNRLYVNTPNISDMSTLKTFKVVDKLDASLTFQSTNKIRVNETDKDITDYASIDYDTSTNTVTYTFDTSKLTANTQYSFTIIMNYNSAVKNKLGTAINNTAQVVYSTKTGTTSSNDTTNTINSNTVETHTGGFQFKKVDNNGNALAGAQFRIYTTLENAKAGTNALSVYTGTDTSLTKTVTSDSNGLVSFYGLYYGSAGTKADTDETTTYYIVEISAPTGYSLLSEPVAVSVSKNTSQSVQLTIKNSLKTELPLTGGLGTVMITAIGVVIVLCGVIFICVWKKKKSTTKNNE
jgi:fimbrial isopeptide formation D2 family protein/LPXTG-motif cell wall-anchored protein